MSEPIDDGGNAFPVTARLIAAAPEMLAAIQGALRIADLWRPPEFVPEEHLEEAQALDMMYSQFEEIVRKSTASVDNQ